MKTPNSHLYDAPIVIAVCALLFFWFWYSMGSRRTSLETVRVRGVPLAQHPAMPLLRQLGIEEPRHNLLLIETFKLEEGCHELKFSLGVAKWGGSPQSVAIRTVRHGSGAASLGPKTEIYEIEVMTSRFGVMLTPASVQCTAPGSNDVVSLSKQQALGGKIYSSLLQELLPAAEQLLAYTP